MTASRSPDCAALRLTTRSCADDRGVHRETNRAGGIEAGVSNGEEIVVRAAMKPLPTLMRPLRTVDLATGDPAEALVERSDTAAVEALAVVAEAVGRLRARAGGTGEVRRRRARRLRRRPQRLPGADRLGAPVEHRHLALIGFMGAGKSTLGRRVAARLARPFVDLDAEIERHAAASISTIFATRGEVEFRAIEEKLAREALDRQCRP